MGVEQGQLGRLPFKLSISASERKRDVVKQREGEIRGRERGRGREREGEGERETPYGRDGRDRRTETEISAADIHVVRCCASRDLSLPPPSLPPSILLGALGQGYRSKTSK